MVVWDPLLHFYSDAFMLTKSSCRQKDGQTKRKKKKKLCFAVVHLKADEDIKWDAKKHSHFMSVYMNYSLAN